MLALPCSKHSLCGRMQNSHNGPSVSLHTAHTYVVANDSVKYQGKSPLGGLEAHFPPKRFITFIGLHRDPLTACLWSQGANNAGDPVDQVRSMGLR